jgi:tetratricopeptide (TPR) repeat protein
MTRNQKPVVIVGILLGALIVLPVVVLFVSRIGGDSPTVVNTDGSGASKNPEEVADFDLRKLAEHAESLLTKDLAEALRKGDVSLDFMASLNRDADKARDALDAGKLDRAEKLYRGVVQIAESQLAALALAEKARALNDSTYSELKRLEYLKSAFENTYREAVETYNSGLRALTAAQFEKSVDDYEMTGAILGDLEARAIQQVGGILESAKAALEAYDLVAAREAFKEVLRIDSANTEATEGLVMVSALEGIAEEIKAIKALENAGKFEAALAQLEGLAAQHPNNPFIRHQRSSIEARILERDYQALLVEANSAEGEGNYAAAIKALESAIALKPTAEQQKRLLELQVKYKAARLEELLASGYDALKAGRYEGARNIYKEAVAIAPDSKEARTGLEKSSSLYLANIRYSQNLTNAAKYVKEGRYPLAAKFFNDAMSSRPSNAPAAQLTEETRLRKAIDAQSSEVAVMVDSDKRTYVSIIGVLPPDRFSKKELKLFPDVYTVKGTRSGYKPVEIELKVDASKQNQTITVECSEKL